ncbi:hypothetical protein BE20_07365 [Sorangium cellulosum]|uniref:Uncharacterized protein n=1 Tax=Sorangium cellulosum TaxID=56 RepID=A0A150SNU9_SORCE|nr:hypothetical protein BE20_07365 [Sorangium cellulosum]KYG00189.1 hypothetical protein BE18_09510 [Sorangium cellulosum]
MRALERREGRGPGAAAEASAGRRDWPAGDPELVHVHLDAGALDPLAPQGLDAGALVELPRVVLDAGALVELADIGSRSTAIPRY